jgi:hypothetical protein
MQSKIIQKKNTMNIFHITSYWYYLLVNRNESGRYHDVH